VFIDMQEIGGMSKTCG